MKSYLVFASCLVITCAIKVDTHYESESKLTKKHDKRELLNILSYGPPSDQDHYHHHHSQVYDPPSEDSIPVYEQPILDHQQPALQDHQNHILVPNHDHHQVLHSVAAVPVSQSLPPQSMDIPQPITLPVGASFTQTITKPIKIPVPVHIDRPVAVPVAVPVPKPYPVYVKKIVHVDRPVPVAVKKYIHVPVQIDRPVAVPVPVLRTYPVIVEKLVAVDKPYPVHVAVPVHVPKPYPVPVAIHYKSHHGW
ncbi:hypothetical protein PV325_004152 [Microctonus aethiopoides]|uniref:Uncharacterized protein n=1 Tax=Microctonus aethiopoides TaxID=144406 RepID=A0AA39C568_9HYME|nr:hypothetical protein PV325_004152 [Microctonus aethiopoides]KAK0097724.1 hypothetical protein PV326_014252 [Microctonus aethiopoides]KAK0158106.1 hypothetical protein PV328_009152 [Microctonus aethiopoides]